jgi:hypothetical protein
MSTATRVDHSRLARPLHFLSCAGMPLARNTRNPAAVCSHSFSELASVRTHTLCTRLIPWKIGRSSKRVQPQLFVPSREWLNLTQIVSAMLPFFPFVKQTSQHLAFYACVAVCWVCRARSVCWCNQQTVYLQHFVIFFVFSKLRYCAEPTFCFGIYFFYMWECHLKLFLCVWFIPYT